MIRIDNWCESNSSNASLRLFILLLDKSFNLLHSPSIMLEGVAEVINEDDPIIKTKQFME